MIALVALFLAGLMVGRTPAFLGKKIRAPESKMIMLYILASSISILLFTALAVLTRAGLAGLVTNTGTHGFTEILFAYASANANNGQNFAGLNANSLFYNLTTAITMMIGRFGWRFRRWDWRGCSRPSSPLRTAPVRCPPPPCRSLFC
jgi:potassium-transporting ATPase potassium-binding subunit